MRILFLAALSAALLAGCGSPRAPGATAHGDADVCGLVKDAAAVFGHAVTSEADTGFGPIAGACRWQSADGVVIGDAALFTADSVRTDADAATPQAMYDKQKAAIDALTDTPLDPVANLGDQATRALRTPSDQTQIVFITGDRVFLVRAASSDPKLDGPALAEKLAHALADAK